MDSRIKLVIISDLTSSLSCHMVHGNNFTLATVRIFKYAQSFPDHANSRIKWISVSFSANPIAHMLRKIKKSMLTRTSMFLMHPTNPQIRKLTLTSLVTSWRFWRCMLKFRQCIVSKDHISMNNGDNFIKLQDNVLTLRRLSVCN